jgi:tryptophan-rich sensory protein
MVIVIAMVIVTLIVIDIIAVTFLLPYLVWSYRPHYRRFSGLHGNVLHVA